MVVAGVAATVLIRRADRPAAAAPVARNFAWAPVAGATGYDVEIQRDGTIVYSTRTTVPHIRVPARWTRGAESLSLTPGTYHWYVWPLKGSDRRNPAVVATTFEISRR